MGYLNSVLSNTSGSHAEDSPVSGGGLSQNEKFSYGYASSPGKRSSMEDFYETRIDGVDGEIVGLFGVFDGHGGARAAEYVKQNLFSNLISHPKFISDTKSAIADAYNHTDSEFLKSENNQNRDAGSTASTAILVGDRLLVANVGDSRAVICRGGNVLFSSLPQKMAQSRGATSKVGTGSNSYANRNSLYSSRSRLSHNASRLGRVGPRCKCWLLTHEKISVSHNNPGRPYFNCPDFPHGCDFFIWGDVDENYMDQASLTDLYGQLQEQGKLIMENNNELRELRSKQLYKKAFTTGFIIATVVWIVLIVLFVCVWKSMN